MRKILMAIHVLFFLSLSAALPVLAEDFVLRAKFPQVKPITTAELDREYNRAVIVDVRSKIEYDVIHIAKARHIPVALGTFLAEVEKTRGKKDAAPLVFYCNGYACAKSYEAAMQLIEAGYDSVFCYDAGVNEWVRTHPERGTLMGRTPADPGRMLSDADFARRTISWEDFRKQAATADSLVIDIREPFQRIQNPQLPQNQILPLSGVRNIPSDRLVPLLLVNEFPGKRLLIADAVGKQVQWLQYYLEEHGYRDYSFLRKGVLGAAEAGAFR